MREDLQHESYVHQALKISAVTIIKLLMTTFNLSYTGSHVQ